MVTDHTLWLTARQDVKTDASQSNPEYKEKQDITAPPDPVANNSTSDVPIQGEKTNILFHPTPSVSYEPTFARIETQATALCGAAFAAIVILGKMFGGSLKGLIPLGICISSAFFLWMKELVRSGREVEWSSEQTRGQTAVANLLPESVEWMNHFMEIVWCVTLRQSRFSLTFVGVSSTLTCLLPWPTR